MFARLRSIGRGGTEGSASILEPVGLGLTVVLLSVATGVTGAVMGGALVLAWHRLPVEYVFALGQVALVVSTDVLGLALLIAVEVSLALLLAGSLSRGAGSYLPGAVWCLSFLALGGGSWVAVTSGVRLWQVAAVLWLVGIVAAYGLYRHQLVTLGLADTDGEHYS